MPHNNRFAHQTYHSGPPQVSWQLVKAPHSPEPGTGAFRELMAAAGRRIREAGVRSVYLVHGTFMGDDAFGLIRTMARLAPGMAIRLRRAAKAALDQWTQDVANYTASFGTEFQQAAQVPTQLFHWSSENTHAGRAIAAVQLIDALAGQGFSQRDRVLLWGHSHAGNVLALITNLLAADRQTQDLFFRACRSIDDSGEGPGSKSSVWARVRGLLAEPASQRSFPKLDVVTFGTPIRYGWDTGGYDRLLHIVYHRPRPALPPYQTAVPRSVDDVLQAADGDYVQQLGIAGTNFLPHLLAFAVWGAERRLGRLLQGRVSTRHLLANWRAGMRIPEEGETLLVDYGPAVGGILQHVAGHAVYTRLAWLAFHASEVASRFYANDVSPTNRSNGARD